MFNLYQILTGAQGGQALDNLAARFGLTREQTDGVVKALLPALSTAFMTKVMHPGGLQEIAGAMTDDHHKQAYADPGIAAAPETQEKGGHVAGSIFGSEAIVATVVREASRYSGVPESTLREMLPVIVSIVLGGVATAMHNQGMGGWLGQIAHANFGDLLAKSGGLGSMFGKLFGAQPAGAPGGGAAPRPGEPASGPGSPWGGFPPAMQAGMDAFGKMFQPGVPPMPGWMGNLGAEISSILSGKRG